MELTREQCITQLRSAMGTQVYNAVRLWCEYVFTEDLSTLTSELYLKYLENLLASVDLDSLSRNHEVKELMSLYLRYLKVINPVYVHSRILAFLDHPELHVPLSRKLYQIAQSANHEYGMAVSELKKEGIQLHKAQVPVSRACILPIQYSLFNQSADGSDHGLSEVNNEYTQRLSKIINHFMVDHIPSRHDCSLLYHRHELIHHVLQNMPDEQLAELNQKINVDRIKSENGKFSAAGKMACALNKYLKNRLDLDKKKGVAKQRRYSSTSAGRPTKI